MRTLGGGGVVVFVRRLVRLFGPGEGARALPAGLHVQLCEGVSPALLVCHGERGWVSAGSPDGISGLGVRGFAEICVAVSPVGTKLCGEAKTSVVSTL